MGNGSLEHCGQPTEQLTLGGLGDLEDGDPIAIELDERQGRAPTRSSSSSRNDHIRPPRHTWQSSSGSPARLAWAWTSRNTTSSWELGTGAGPDGKTSMVTE